MNLVAGYCGRVLCVVMAMAGTAVSLAWQILAVMMLVIL
jgi:hypothetical protein